MSRADRRRFEKDEACGRPSSSVLEMKLSDTELPQVIASPIAPETRRGRRMSLAILLVASFAVVAWIVSPLWVGIALGTVMAFTAQPAYRRLNAWIGDRRRTAAATTTLASGLLCAGVVTLVLYIVSNELLEMVAALRTKTGGSFVDLLGPRTLRWIERLGLNPHVVDERIHQQLVTATGFITSTASVILQMTTSVVFGLIVALVTMYYVLLEWPRLAVRLESILPLDPRHTRALILEFRDVGRGALVGTVATAVVQGALAGVCYWIAGASQVLTWSVFTALASFIPVVGTGAVWGPIGVHLMLNGHAVAGAFVLIWGLCVVMTVTDYVIRPHLVGRNGHSHPLLVLMALLGGIEVFGLPGLIVAPILMSLFLAVLRIYERTNRPGRGSSLPPWPTPQPTGATPER